MKKPKKRAESKKSKSKKMVGSKSPRRKALGPRKARPAAKGARPADIKGLNVRDLAALICSGLTAQGFDPVLTGRACAAIYGGPSIHPDALDFVISEYVISKIKAAMGRLGFQCRVHRTYGSKNSEIEVTFLPPPLCVGDNIVEDVHVVRTSKGDLRMLGSTDCVRQRLSMYYRFADQDALRDAVLVAKRHRIDMELVKRWSHWEWASDKFDDFQKLMGADNGG